MDKKDFFISYTNSDELWAKWIAWQLEDEGYSTVIQCWDFVTGNFVDKINDALINSERYIPVISPAYFKSDWCRAEWTALFTKDPANKNSTLIPVMAIECKPEGLFAPLIYIKLAGLGEGEAKLKLLNAVNTGRPKVKPVFPGGKTTAAGKPVFPPCFPMNNLPTRNNNFTGREDILDSIHKSFQSGNYAALTQSVTGMGGVGKSQTALEYAYRYAGNYDVIWWINAESFDTLLLGFTEFAHDSGLVDRNIIDRSIIVGSIKNWMAQSGRWLFIFDNAEKPDDIKEYIPGMSKGNILITSRFAGWRNYSEIGIDVFEPEDAADFLIKSTKIEDMGGAEELAEELGCLPLALEQAAAYISSSGKGYKAYLELYRKHRLEMFKSEMSRPKDYSGTIAVTWNISIENIESESAKQLLYICSFFSGHGIDKSIFTNCADCLPEPLAGDVKDDFNYNGIIFELTKYSLIKNESNSFSMHRLLQEVIRDSLNKGKWLLVCLNITNEKYCFDQYDMNTWGYVSLMLRHALSIAAYAEEEGAGLEVVGRIYHNSGMWLKQTAAYSEALTLLKKAQSIIEGVYGKEHSGTAATYNNIALIYDDQGDYEKALEWYGKAREVTEKVLGKDHPSTATTYNNIALVYGNQEKYEKSLEWHGKALEVKEKVLGKDHPSTSTTYSNIAGVYKDQEEYEKALEWYGKALEIDERVLGKEHPYTASTYNNIALVYNRQGYHEKALEWYKKALEVDEKILGKEHPDTAATYNNIAFVYYKQRDHEKALGLLIKALRIYIKRQMAEYPNAKTTFTGMVAIYLEAGGKKEDFQKWLLEKLQEDNYE